MGTEATQIPDPKRRRTTSSFVPPETGMTANSFDMSQGGDAGKVLFGLVCVVAIAWIYLLASVGVEMEQMGMGGGKMMLCRQRGGRATPLSFLPCGPS
ncbi:MAG: hypothetical protein WB586_16600 [Chthoniobacterales bacterium]